ncbi:highly acidic protein [Campylobacter coli]|nr:highly acidic protein [Campylobacter coli]HEC1513241.1 highly acidic protein [Campylobacter coli]
MAYDDEDLEFDDYDFDDEANDDDFYEMD